MKNYLYFWEDFEINKKVNLGTYEFTKDEIIKFGKKFDTQFFHVNPKLAMACTCRNYRFQTELIYV